MANQHIEATVNVNSAELFYGVDGTGEPLLLLHGGTGCHSDWVYAGREHLVGEYRVIAPDARGHGRSTNLQKTVTHRQCALEPLALLDHLGVERCKAIGVSTGGNILLHMATMQPERIEAMVVVSATMYFPELARKIMAALPAPENQPASEWEAMRKRHHLGDRQIYALWEWACALKDSYDDMNFAAEDLSAIRARTLVVQGDRDFLYPWRCRSRCTVQSRNHRCGSYPVAGMGLSSRSCDAIRADGVGLPEGTVIAEAATQRKHEAISYAISAVSRIFTYLHRVRSRAIGPDGRLQGR